MSALHNPRAFPSSAIDDRLGGMDLRDWFAGHAAAAEVASAGANIDAAMALAEAADEAGQTIPERIAFNAYQVADAMLAERAKGSMVAAAPELLDALEGFNNWFSGFNPDDRASVGEGCKVVIRARAAIAKARGQA